MSDLKEFACEWSDGDCLYGFTIWAQNYRDAERRLERIKSNGRVVGTMQGRVSLSRGNLTAFCAGGILVMCLVTYFW